MPYEINNNKAIQNINNDLDALSDPSPAPPSFTFQRWVPSRVPYVSGVDYPIFTDSAGYVYNFQLYEYGQGNSNTHMFGFTINSNNPNMTIDDSNHNENFAYDWYAELSIVFDSSTQTVTVQPIITEGTPTPTYIIIQNVNITSTPTGFNYFIDEPINANEWSDYESGFGFILENYTPWYNPTI